VPGPRAPAAAPSAEAGEKSDALILRYTALVLGRPGEPFPLERLVELYRQRDGNPDRLVAELTLRADKPGEGQYAALVALAGALRHDAQQDRAVATYERAIAEAPKNPVAVLALGRLLEAVGDKAGARHRFEEALPGVTGDVDREQLLHTLLGLELDLRDYDAAKLTHAELVRRAKGSFFARSELGRELLVRGEAARAEAEYREVVKAAAGDNRALAPALKDLGQALARDGKADEALEVLARALTAAGTQSGLRREVLDVMVEVYRGKGGVAELVQLLEKQHPDDFERLGLQGALYEETGRVADALSAYQRALAQKDDLATRLKVVQLLEVQGKLDEATREYEKLIHAAPHDPQFVFRLVDTLIQRGDRTRAIQELERLEARSAGDDETASQLVDLYERIGETGRSMKLLDRLAKSGGNDPRHVIELGDHYFRQGDTKRAIEVWERIRALVPDRARALHAQGEVLLEHDLAELALAALQQAADLAPREPKYQKALALALERVGTNATGAERGRKHEAARRIWEKVLLDPAMDKLARREARQHIVSIWSMDDRDAQTGPRGRTAGIQHLTDHTRPLERRLAQVPPDLEAGRLLGELYSRLRRPVDAERVLRRVVLLAPGDEESYLALERALVLERKLGEAIQVLERLTKLDARRAREYYQRMAQHSAELYRDDDAIRYASKAVELSPDDAEGHRKLGEMYRRRQDIPHAVLELRLALAKNDRLFSVYFDLAELLLTRGELDEADRLLRRVMRAAPDDDLVARATRLSMQVNLGRGTLETLERELLPVALGNPMRPVYRRLLVEVYGNLAFPLVHDSKGADATRAAEAQAALRRIGERAVKPLLDALGDERGSQAQVAVELLSHISNRSAGPALVSFALGKADGDLRTRAMLAVGTLEAPAILPRLRAVIAPSGNVRVDETDTVAIAAAWGVARMRSPAAHGLLVEMLSSDAPSVRSLAAIGLGLLGGRADVRLIVEIAGSADQEPSVRAAAAFALGVLGGDAAGDTLTRLADAPDPLLRSTAVLGLARVRAKTARRAIAAALVNPDVALRDAATDAALVLSAREYRIRGEVLRAPDERVEIPAVLAALGPSGYTADERAHAVSELGPELMDAAVTAVHSGAEGARVVADALLARGGRPAFAPLTDGMDGASPEARAASELAIEGILRAIVAPFLALARHPSADVRVRAIRVLALRSEPEARAAVVGALEDPDAGVQRVALAVLSSGEDASALSVVTKLSQEAEAWAVRARATDTLGALARGAGEDRAVPVLARIAEQDPIAFVRETAIRALGVVQGVAARAALGRVLASDPEPRVRDLARALLEGAAHAPRGVVKGER
jgi:tetratricopeptide (TPR) repeat protein